MNESLVYLFIFFTKGQVCYTKYSCEMQGNTVVLWLSLLPHSKRFCGLNNCGFLLQFKEMLLSLKSANQAAPLVKCY